MYFEIQKDKMGLEERSKVLDLLIAKNEQTIRETNELLAKIQKAKLSGDEKQRFNAMQAEQLANQGLSRAKVTQKNLQKQQLELQMAMQRLNEVEQRLRDSYLKIDSMLKPSGFVKECSGGVKIMNQQTKRLEDACSAYTPLQEEDVITASSDGRVEFKILDGRGNFILGPNSTIVVKKDTPEEQAIGLVDGKVHIQVEKPEKYSNKMKELIEVYKQDLKTIKGWTDEKIEEMKKMIAEERRRFIIWYCEKQAQRMHKIYSDKKVVFKDLEFTDLLPDSPVCRKPLALGGIRGTEVIAEKNGEYAGKISVIEGTVEIEIPEASQNKKIVIPGGYTAVINLDGSVKQEKIKTIDKWWRQ